MSHPSTPAPAGHRRAQIAARVGAATLGGYAFAWGFIATCMSLLFAAGMAFHDAEFLAMLLGVLAFLAAFLWAFAVRRLWMAWALLLGGGALLATIGTLVQTTQA
ncbi:MAG: iron uptake protein [Thermomonas sp.]|uniref:iron uptake protein n=1 Tax=Thermomonas sp. TaxID=1971895 RepID=UPI0039E2F8DA